MQHANTEGVPDRQSLRRYVRRAYCGRFDKKGWVGKRSEVVDYIERLRKEGPVACDDGTAIGVLGVPWAGWQEPGTSR